MKVFIWERVEQCSDFYHPEGGVVVFAEDETSARALANSYKHCSIREDEKPDCVRDFSETYAAVYVFPDAGCC